jgi:nifR3 family TIM-barrel protein
MNLGFWKKAREQAIKENRPLLVMAPMADVTDPAFRVLIAEKSRMGKEGGGPDALWTEFVSADGLMSPGREALIADLKYTEIERPIVAQLFTGNPEKMFEASKLVQELGFDALDINMGCPDRSVEKQGGGASLIKNPERAREIIRSAKLGAPNLPVSVKTRIGYNRRDELVPWLTNILLEEPAVLTVHARTRKEMSKVPARWEHVAEAVELRDKLQAHIPREDRTLIFGNGDIETIKDAYRVALETKADGVMIGRGIFGKPWLFDRTRAEKYPDDVYGGYSIQERLNILKEHIALFENMVGHKNFAVMKKHFKAYVTGWDGAKELRTKMMESDSPEEICKIIEEYK